MRPESEAPQSNYREIALASPADREVTGVRVLFVPARAFIRDVRLHGLPDGMEPKGSFNGAGCSFDWKPPIKPKTNITIKVESFGDPVREFTVSWVPFESTDADSLGSSFADIRKDLSGAQSAADLSTLAAHMHRRVRDAVDQLPEAIRANASFFRAYDYQTNPNIFPEPGIFVPQDPHDSVAVRTNNMKILGPLEGRAKARGKWRSEGRAGPAQGLKAMDAAKIEYFSKLQLGIFKTHFGSNIDIDKFWTAFEQFMNGELRVPQGAIAWNGEPNSADAYVFAEYAFAAAETSSDAATWRSLAKPLVAVQRIYNEVYKPLVALRSLTHGFLWGHYDAGNFRTSKMVSSAFKTAVRNEYASKSFDDVRVAMGDNAFAAFGGEYH